MDKILYDYKQVIKNGLPKEIDTDIIVLSLMEKFHLGRQEIESWDTEFFELAVSKVNIDEKIKQEMQKENDLKNNMK